jgi:putative acetyltransferase
MADAPRIGVTTSSDLSALSALYAAAFPDENLMPLVERLLTEVPNILSLAAATWQEHAVAHVIITPCETNGAGDVALLGPLAVAPAHQRRGLGTALIRAGISRLDPAAVQTLLVLGDPAYYGRHGFQRETKIVPPYPLPEEWRGAWQSLRIGTSQRTGAGTLRPPQPWMSAALWSP